MNRLSSCLLLALASACAPVDEHGEPELSDTDQPHEVSGVSQPLSSEKLGPLSGEEGRNSARCSDLNRSIGTAVCQGRFCDDLTLYCDRTLPRGVTTSHEFATMYTSDEDSRGVSCSSGNRSGVNGVMTGLRITGTYSDNLSLRCRRIVGGHLEDCHWLDPFSEEFDWMSQAPYQYHFAGVRCSGAHCDNVTFRACRIVAD